METKKILNLILSICFWTIVSFSITISLAFGYTMYDTYKFLNSQTKNAILKKPFVEIQQTEPNTSVQNIFIVDYSTNQTEHKVEAPIYIKDYLKKKTFITQLENFTTTKKEARDLATTIFEKADKYNLNYEIAFALIHIESDFTVQANNKRSKAKGLCQITKPCLTEYNRHHTKQYKLEDMLEAEKNLEVGFWYFSRIINHYASFPQFGITTSNEASLFRDAYIAYNIGVAEFKKIGKIGRNQLRSGVCPSKFSYAPKGTRYEPYYRYNEKLQIWQDCSL